MYIILYRKHGSTIFSIFHHLNCIDEDEFERQTEHEKMRNNTYVIKKNRVITNTFYYIKNLLFS